MSEGLFPQVQADLSPHAAQDRLLEQAPRQLAFDPSRDYQSWRSQLRDVVRRLVGLMPQPVQPNLRIVGQTSNDLFTETQFLFTSEANADVPCHLLVPTKATNPAPVMICLQGHSTGMHISLGRARSDADQHSIDGGRDIAIQALKEGYAALVMEVRCFGIRGDQRPDDRKSWAQGCHHASMAALLLGRTAIGERCWDISRAIDLICSGAFEGLDSSRIGVTGNSGGGTLSYWSAALDERIALSIPSCYFCTFAESIGKISHCQCNYVPGVLQYFEMPDLAALIAPRPLIIVAGQLDEIFPIQAVRGAFETVRQIYSAAGAPDNCRLLVGPDGHRYYPDLAWPAMAEVTGWKHL